MKPLAIAALTFLLVLPAHAGNSPDTETEAVGSFPGKLSGRRLTRFLGPVSPDRFTWSEGWDPIGVIYDGVAKPPLSGDVYITIVLGPAPWSHMPTPGGPDRVGVLQGSWTNPPPHEGIYGAGFGFADADNNWLKININSPVQADVQTIAAEVARLPIFNSTPETPFRAALVRNRIIRVVCWLLLPCLFAATICLADRYVRRRRRTWFLRAITLAAMSALWLGLFIAAVKLSPLGDNGVLTWYYGEPRLFWLVGVASFCAIAGICGAVGIMLWHLLATAFGQRSRRQI